MAGGGSVLRSGFTGKAAEFQVLRSALTTPPISGENASSHGRTRTYTHGRTDDEQHCARQAVRGRARCVQAGLPECVLFWCYSSNSGRECPAV